MSRLDGRDAGDVPAVDQHLAGVGELEPGDDPQRGRLAAAGRAEQRDELARRDLQRHLVKRPGRAEGAGEAAQRHAGAATGAAPRVSVQAMPAAAFAAVVSLPAISLVGISFLSSRGGPR